MLGLLGPRQTIDISCDVDIEQTPESFHAYAIPTGIEIREGDIVTVHDAPTNVAFGQHVTMQCRATVQRANLADRIWTRFTSLLELTELYEVGFSPREKP